MFHGSVSHSSLVFRRSYACSLVVCSRKPHRSFERVAVVALVIVLCPQAPCKLIPILTLRLGYLYALMNMTVTLCFLALYQCQVCLLGRGVSCCHAVATADTEIEKSKYYKPSAKEFMLLKTVVSKGRTTLCS